MKKELAYLSLLFLLSCTRNHEHDGVYKAAVFTNSSMTWVNDEVIEFNGNDMFFKAISITDGRVLSEQRLSCTQYSDRIEFEGKDGVITIVHFDENGNVKYGAYTYKKIDKYQDDAVKEVKEEPLVKKNKNDTYTINLFQGKKTNNTPEEKLNDEENNPVGDFMEDGNSNLERLFVYIKNNIFIIKKANKDGVAGETLFIGSRKMDGRFIKKNGQESDFKQKDGNLYKFSNNKWIKYIDQKCGM